jgi:hypothetical protein
MSPLWSWLDSESDNRLSGYEVQHADERLLQLSRENRLTPESFPDRLRLTFVRDTARRPPLAPSQLTTEAATPDENAWFASMDGNADGKIARREFLGDESLFLRLDQNQDGVLTSTEFSESAE